MTIECPSWNAVNDTAVSHGTSTPLPSIITEVRTNFSDGFVDRIKFDHSTSSEWNAIKGTVGCGNKSIAFSFYLFSNES